MKKSTGDTVGSIMWAATQDPRDPEKLLVEVFGKDILKEIDKVNKVFFEMLAKKDELTEKAMERLRDYIYEKTGLKSEYEEDPEDSISWWFGVDVEESEKMTKEEMIKFFDSMETLVEYCSPFRILFSADFIRLFEEKEEK